MDTIFEIKHLEGVRYIEEGEGETLLCLYGLFGSLKNFYHQIEFFKKSYKVIVPDLPLLEQNIFSTNINGIVDIVEKFIKHKNLKDINLIGNSLGGHIALNYTLANSQQVKSLILTGSSGLFEHGMGDSYPKKGDYNFIKNKVEFTFYNPEVANKELVDEVFAIVNDRLKVLKIIHLARSAIKTNLGKELYKITIPTAIIWGENDKITPPEVAFEFNKLIAGSSIHFISECGHAPMMERPQQFNAILADFLHKLKA